MSAARLQYSTMHNNVAAALPRALIFDVDGTLAETEELHRRAFNATFAEFGFDWV